MHKLDTVTFIQNLHKNERECYSLAFYLIFKCKKNAILYGSFKIGKLDLCKGLRIKCFQYCSIIIIVAVYQPQLYTLTVLSVCECVCMCVCVCVCVCVCLSFCLRTS